MTNKKTKQTTEQMSEQTTEQQLYTSKIDICSSCPYYHTCYRYSTHVPR